MEEKACNNCPKQVAPGRKYCDPCLASWRKSGASRRGKRKAQNLCKDCGEPSQPGRSRCTTHLNKAKLAKRKRACGVSAEDFEAAVLAQNGLCKICSDPLTTGVTGRVADHCHKTGKFRGVLCNPCNKGLGFFRDSLARLSSAFEYVLSA